MTPKTCLIRNQRSFICWKWYSGKRRSECINSFSWIFTSWSRFTSKFQRNWRSTCSKISQLEMPLNFIMDCVYMVSSDRIWKIPNLSNMAGTSPLWKCNPMGMVGILEKLWKSSTWQIKSIFGSTCSNSFGIMLLAWMFCSLYSTF